MNSLYLYEYASRFERLLSLAYQSKYTLSALEKNIANSSFFKSIENDNDTFTPIITEKQLTKVIMPELVNFDLTEIPVLKQCLWASESYLRIQGKSKLTFECIFLYIPINKMYEYFNLYHEMDFSQIVDEFERLHNEKSILTILTEKYKFTLKTVGKMIDIPYDTLTSLANRRRDIKKASAEIVIKLAKFFHVRPETILEISI